MNEGACVDGGTNARGPYDTGGRQLWWWVYHRSPVTSNSTTTGRWLISPRAMGVLSRVPHLWPKLQSEWSGCLGGSLRRPKSQAALPVCSWAPVRSRGRSWGRKVLDALPYLCHQKGGKEARPPGFRLWCFCPRVLAHVA